MEGQKPLKDDRGMIRVFGGLKWRDKSLMAGSGRYSDKGGLCTDEDLLKDSIGRRRSGGRRSMEKRWPGEGGLWRYRSAFCRTAVEERGNIC